jgi:hypothetical protein
MTALGLEHFGPAKAKPDYPSAYSLLIDALENCGASWMAPTIPASAICQGCSMKWLACATGHMAQPCCWRRSANDRHHVIEPEWKLKCAARCWSARRSSASPQTEARSGGLFLRPDRCLPRLFRNAQSRRAAPPREA